jgi:hypothetical protein
VEPNLIWLAGQHIVAPHCRTFLPHQAHGFSSYPFDAWS